MRTALSVTNLFGQQPSSIVSGVSQRVVLYEESADTVTGTTFSGQAVWRRQVESAAAGPSGVLLTVDAEIPQKNLILKMSLRRAPDHGSAVSHFVELRFLSSARP